MRAALPYPSTDSVQAAAVWEPPYRYQAVETDTGTVYRKIRLTPEYVLRSLPPDATPAQQDSAIQAHFRPNIVAPSARPDTLSLPGLKAEPFRVRTQTTDWQKGYFNGRPYFHEEVRIVQPGMAGDPLPYKLQRDDYVTGALLLSFFFIVRILVRSHDFLVRQVKNFFYSREREDLFDRGTESELGGQLFLVFQTCVVLGILFFDYTQTYLTTVFREISPYRLLGIDIGLCMLYFVLKTAVYSLVNWVFFDKNRMMQWLESYWLVVLGLGVVLFPVVLLVVYFALPMPVLWGVFVTVLILSKLLLLYKVRKIFFTNKSGYVRLFMYFCTLEILPGLVLWRALVSINQNLVVIF